MSSITINSSSPVTARIIKSIRGRIFSNHYAPGEVLPSELQLAEELGASRGVISNALSEIAADGLIEQSRGRGTHVLADNDSQVKTTVAIVLAHQREPNWQRSLIMRGYMVDAVAELGMRCQMVTVSGNIPRGERADSNWITSKDLPSLQDRYGGLLLFESVGACDQILELQDKGVAVVVARLEDDLNVMATRVNHRQLFTNAANVLISMGHRRIGLLSRDSSESCYADAQQGYLDALSAAGIEVDPSLIVKMDIYSPLDCYFLAKELISRPDRPTAIIAGRDYMAEGPCRAIEEAGLVLGRDISVIGFDDQTWPAGRSFLTTFREPDRELAALAAEMIFDRMVSGSQPPRQLEVPAPLLLRRSVGPAPGADISEPLEMIVQYSRNTS